MKKYDYVIVGGGLFAGTFAYFAKKAGKSCLVVEKRETLGGNLYCEDVEGIHVHKYGAPYFSYEQQKSMGFREFSCGVQPLHKLPGGKL